MQSSPFKGRLPLPQVPLPDDTVCYDVELPNEPRILEAFEGMIQLLSRWPYWERDEARRGAVAAKVFADLYQRLEARKCTPNIKLIGGADEGNEQLIRQNPDNPCLLETSINGTDWCAFADLSKCVPAGAQPGSGSPQPEAGGGQACYNARMQSSGKWLLPTQVSTGDTIVVSNVKGSATDGTTTWFCPNGQTFFLGACSGATTTASGDPLNTKPHMELIAKISGTYYEMYNAGLTIPGGISLANVEFQMNDGTLSDNYGEITFDVCVTNNATPTWSQTFDFITASGGWAGTMLDTAPDAVWSAGAGWKAQCGLGDGGVNYYQMCNIFTTALHSTTLTGVTVTADRATNGSNITLLSDAIQITGLNLFLRTSSFPTGSNLTMTWAGSQAWNSGQKLQFNWAQDIQHIAGHSCPLVATPCGITKAVITGTGVNPFV